MITAKKITKILMIGFFGLVGFSEIGLRFAGVIDFPVYDTDSEIGYIPQSSQQGAFLRKNHWAVNASQMDIAEPWSPNGNKDVLLIGDSLVWGGNPYDQPQKLGPQLQNKLTGWKVWPVSAGSWSVENPQVWMKRHPEVTAETDVFIWVINSGDFAPASQWSNKLTHPKTKPVSAVYYVVGKYILPRLNLSDSKEKTGMENPFNATIASAWATKLRQMKSKVIVVLYPAKGQLKTGTPGNEKYKKFKDLAGQAKGENVSILDLAIEPGWNADFYRDDIHPTPAGNQFISEKLTAILTSPQ